MTTFSPLTDFHRGLSGAHKEAQVTQRHRLSLPVQCQSTKPADGESLDHPSTPGSAPILYLNCPP